MSNRTTNGYRLTAKFWLWMAQQADSQNDPTMKQTCLEKALESALWEERNGY